MNTEILFMQCCYNQLAVVRGSAIIVCNFIYMIEAPSMAEEDSIITHDKDNTLKNANDDDVTVMSLEDGIGCVYGKLILLG